MIQKFVNHLFDKRYSQAYLKGIYFVLQQALEQAVKDDLISKNPAGLVEMPKKTDNIRREALTPEEQARFVEEAQKYNQYGEAFLLMLARTSIAGAWAWRASTCRGLPCRGKKCRIGTSTKQSRYEFFDVSGLASLKGR